MAQRPVNFSAFVSKTLNFLGYTWQMVKLRRVFAKIGERMGNMIFLTNSGMTSTSVGSKREGVTTPLGGDSDNMGVFNEVICTEDVEFFNARADLTVIEIDTSGCPPGYALLTPIKHGGRYFQKYYTNEASQELLKILIDSSCLSIDNRMCLSSDTFFNTMRNALQLGIDIHKDYLFPQSVYAGTVSLQPRSGPSIPSITDNNFVKASFDNVYAFPCHCPRVFEPFRTRRRRHGWPPEHILQEISHLEAHVVPIGDRKSDCHFLQWRICFTKAEILLIECLSEPQIHVFILLKIFAKDVLITSWDAMTSYVMKNIILWICELSPSHNFRIDTIVYRFLDCLFFLQICLKIGTLPNYMIPERNLLRHDNFIVKRRKLISVLDECLEEKGSCLFRSNRLNEAMIKMYSTPELTYQHGLDRERSERVILAFMTRLMPDMNLGLSLQDILQSVISGSASELIDLFHERFSDDEIIRDPVNAIKQMLQVTFAHLR